MCLFVFICVCDFFFFVLFLFALHSSSSSSSFLLPIFFLHIRRMSSICLCCEFVCLYLCIYECVRAYLYVLGAYIFSYRCCYHTVEFFLFMLTSSFIRFSAFGVSCALCTSFKVTYCFTTEFLRVEREEEIDGIYRQKKKRDIRV